MVKNPPKTYKEVREYCESRSVDGSYYGVPYENGGVISGSDSLDVFIFHKEDEKYYYHRLDGPALVYSDGGVEYWVQDEFLTKEQFDKCPLVIEARLGKIIDEVLNEEQ